MPLTPEQAAALGLPVPPAPKKKLTADEASALGLPVASRPAAGSSSSAPPADPTRWSQQLGEGMVPGFNRLAAAAQAAFDPVLGRNEYWGRDFGTRYAEHLRANNYASDQTRSDHPLLSAVVQTAGSAPTAALTGGGLGQAAGLGAAYGAGASRSEDVTGVLKDAGVGAGAGAAAAALPRALLGVENTGRAALDALRPRVKPTPEAQLLMSEGVPLTVGQTNPGSLLGQLEKVSTHNPLGMAPEREAAKTAFMRVAQNKGVAPGARAPESDDLQGRLAELFKGYEKPYSEIRDTPIPADAVSSLPEAAKMPGRGVDARTAAGVKAEVENALTVLGIKPQSAGGHGHHGHGAPAEKPQGLLDAYGREIPPTPPPPPKATAGDLLKVRENLRENIRAARQAQDFDRLRLLDQAEEVVTGALEKSLTPEQSAKLAATDRQYARLMTAANAAPAGQTEFTPLQYLKQVEKGAGRRAFKSGGAGDLQDLGEAARAVFQDLPLTGVRGAILSTIPGMSYASAPISRFVNLPAVRAGFGQLPYTPAQPVASAPIPGLSEEAARALLAALQGPRVALPVGAAEDRPR